MWEPSHAAVELVAAGELTRVTTGVRNGTVTVEGILVLSTEVECGPRTSQSTLCARLTKVRTRYLRHPIHPRRPSPALEATRRRVVAQVIRRRVDDECRVVGLTNS